MILDFQAYFQRFTIVTLHFTCANKTIKPIKAASSLQWQHMKVLIHCPCQSGHPASLNTWLSLPTIAGRPWGSFFKPCLRCAKAVLPLYLLNVKPYFIADWKPDFVLTFKPFAQHKYRERYLSLLVLTQDGS